MCGVVGDEEHALCFKTQEDQRNLLQEIVKYKCTFIEIIQCYHVYTIKNPCKYCKYLFTVIIEMHLVKLTYI